MIDGICVPPNLAKELWPSVSSLIRAAMVRGGLNEFEDVEREVLEGRMLLWVVLEGTNLIAAIVTQLSIIGGIKYGTIVACGGRGIETYEHLIDRLDDYFRAEGCKFSRILGRPGWQRRFTRYRTKAVILEKAL